MISKNRNIKKDYEEQKYRDIIETKNKKEWKRKMKKIRLCIGVLAIALMIPMSGCSVSISFGTNKNTETEKETEDKTEKKTETEEQEEKAAEPTEQPKEATATATSTPEPVKEETTVSTPEPEVRQQPAAESTQQKTPQYVTYYVVNCKQSITLRTSPSTEAGEICQIPLGSAVSYISVASNGFYYISYNGNTGYALASYLSSSSGGSYYDTCRVVNCKQSITLRPSPDVDSGEICQIPLGATVSFVGTAANGFYEIYYMGNHGYSLADYLEFQ